MKGNDQTVNGNGQPANVDQAAILARADGNDVFEQIWGYDDFAAAEDRSADVATGLVSLAFIRSAIRRGARFWCATAIAGMLFGLAVYVAIPPAYQASTSVLLTYGAYENPLTAVNDAQAIAESQSVARLAMRRLGLRQSPASFAAAYTVAGVSTRVLLITVRAPSSGAAVRRARAVAAAFLSFRAGQLEAEQRLLLSSLDQQISQARQQVGSVSQRIRQVSAQPASQPRQASLRRLRTELSQSEGTLSALRQSASSSQVSTATALAVKGSQVLDAAAPIRQSRLRRLLLYPVVGLILGLALGAGIVVVQAFTTDRLRRRDDVARALGAPVKLSVSTKRLSRWLPGPRGPAAARSADIQRIVAHLRGAVPASTRGARALAVVAVDDPQAAALSLVELAISCAREGRQVVLADLCGGAPAASLLGARGPGVHRVSVQGGDLVVAIPDRDDPMPAGPRRPRTRRSRATDRAPDQAQSSFTDAVTAAYASADLLLTLAVLDPSVGGDHLATWTTTVVAVVTAGRSSATRLHATGEMIRLAGTRLVSAVLTGADKTDESLGAVCPPGEGRYAENVESGVAS